MIKLIPFTDLLASSLQTILTVAVVRLKSLKPFLSTSACSAWGHGLITVIPSIRGVSSPVKQLRELLRSRCQMGSLNAGLQRLCIEDRYRGRVQQRASTSD